MGFVVFIRIVILLLFVSSTAIAKGSPVVVEILADDDYPPYSYVENGEVKGIYVDLVTEASKLLVPAYEVKIVALPWKRALKQIENGERFAILPPYHHAELRPYIFPYSVPMAQEDVVVYCRKDIDFNKVFIDSIRLPEPLLLGINSGYILLNDKYNKAIKNNNLMVVENKSTEANVVKLTMGRIDCYINDRLSIEHGLVLLNDKESSFNMSNFIQVDHISSQSAHIGYTNVKEYKYPYKYDFVVRMNEALKAVNEGRTRETEDRMY